MTDNNEIQNGLQEGYCRELVWISDPGHAWLKVPKALYSAYKVHASPFSYQDTDSVYLEEDCDATLFINAAGIGDWYIPTKWYPQQMGYSDVHPRDMERLNDPEYVRPEIRA